MPSLSIITSFLGRNKVIERFLRASKGKLAVYGAQSIKAQTGFLARPTDDYDIHSPTPKRCARRLERELDKDAGTDAYYVKPARHQGTSKVSWVGYDGRKGTDDDEGVADFTNIGKRRTITINGIRYTTLHEASKDKLKSLRDPEYAFRHAKDADDLSRIRAAQKLKRYF